MPDGGDRDAWLERRRTRVGGSDVAAVCDWYALTRARIPGWRRTQPYSTARSVWREKRGGGPPEFSEASLLRMAAGRALEDRLATAAERLLGRPVKAQQKECDAAPQCPRLVVTIDGLLWGEDGSEDGCEVLEIKTTSPYQFSRWTDPYTGEVRAPDHYRIQCQAALAATGFDAAIIWVQCVTIRRGLPRDMVALSVAEPPKILPPRELGFDCTVQLHGEPVAVPIQRSDRFIEGVLYPAVTDFWELVERGEEPDDYE